MTTVNTLLPSQVVFDFATLVTVKVTEVTVSDSDVDTGHVPAVPVVHVLAPLAPADICTVTVAPDTGVPDPSVTFVAALAVHDRLAFVADPMMVAWVAPTGEGGGTTRRV